MAGSSAQFSLAPRPASLDDPAAGTTAESDLAVGVVGLAAGAAAENGDRGSRTIRALLVEDDERIRRVLSLALTDMGFDIAQAPSGESALMQLQRDGTDVVLLDLTLPGMDGLELCRLLRQRGDMPIIIVTARSETADVISGLEAGADDYMTKPLVASELAARIRALLRRRRPQATNSDEVPIRIGDLEIAVAKGVVIRDDRQIHLTRTEFGLLAELATAEGRIVTREELLQRVWGYDYFGDTRLLDVHVRRLRRKIERDPDHPVLVLTVRGVGYRAAGGRE